MEIVKEKIDLKNLDKSSWKSFKFEEIAQKISKTVKPEEAEVDIYVGLEHLDAEDIHIRRKGVPADVKGGKLRCYPGDIIFGKRRAYQRKAAIVDFDGICSAHAFIFRANSEVIDPKLFPFFLHSDQFMHRMVDISVGGLSPTINWGDLKNQEFLLPPKDQQVHLAKLLWAMDEVIEKEKNLLNRSEISKSTFIEGLLTGSIRLGGFYDPWQKFSMDELAKYRRGSFPQPYGSKEWYDEINGSPFVQVYDIDYNLKLKKETKAKISEKAKPMSVFVPKGTLIISIQGSIGRVAVTQYDAYVDRTILIFQDFLKEIDFKYFTYTIQRIFRIAEKTAPGATIKTITKEALSRFEINLPSFEEQKLIGERLSLIDQTVIEIKMKIEATQSLQKSLINQVF